MQSFKPLFLLALAMFAGFAYGKAWWSFVQEHPVDGAVVLGLIGLGFLGSLAMGSLQTARDWGRHCVGGAVMLAGYLVASL